MNTTRKAIQFDTRSAAEAWLKSTSNYGFIHDCSGYYIALQFADGRTWAFTAPDEMVVIPGW